MYKQEGVSGPAAAEHPPKNSLSLDGEHFVLVPERLARLAAFAEKLQERVNRVKNDMEVFGMEIEEVNEGFDKAIDLVKGINCHKAVLFARGEIGKDLLLAIPTKETPELGGHPEVLNHLAANPERQVLTPQALEEHLLQIPPGNPQSVHILRKQEGEWIPAHSFVYAGIDDAGNKICFHKKGPLLRMGFETATLEKVMQHYQGEIYSFLVLPMNDLEEAA